MPTKDKILVVDDSPESIWPLVEHLESEYEIIYATTAEKALTLAFSGNRPNLILLDIMMPDMDGYEVCATLKADPLTKDIPIIFLTAKTTEDSLKKGFESGGVDFISKPFKTAELVARVNTHIQLKAVREILSKTNIQLQEANSNKDKLLSIIAHDLRNPFSVLITFSKLLLDSFDDFSKDDIINYLETFYQTSKQGHSLLDNLLKWSKSQTGAISVKGEVIDFKDVVEENITLLNSQAKSKNIELINSVPQDVFAFADLNMVLTVIRNLLSNAIKFSNNGGKVEIAGKNHDKFVEIAIKDNGIGISEEGLEKIFRIDMKYSTPGTARERGSGLGLVLCREFIEKNFGTLAATSKPGEGSEFVFTLPRAG